MNTLTQNQLKHIRNLLQKKFREEKKKFFVEGIRGIEEALQSDWEFEMLIATEKNYSSDSGGKIFSVASKKCIPFFSTSEKEIAKLSDTESSQGIIAVIRQKLSIINYQLSTLIIALDSINDPGNLGTILRTCDWFGTDGVLLGKNCVELYNPKVVRASMGAIFHLPIVVNVDLENELPKLKGQKFQIASTSSHTKKSLFEISIPKKSVIIFGSEAHGISPSLEKISDIQFSIPKFGKAESLNVASACSSVLTAWKMQS